MGIWNLKKAWIRGSLAACLVVAGAAGPRLGQAEEPAILSHSSPESILVLEEPPAPEPLPAAPILPNPVLQPAPPDLKNSFAAFKHETEKDLPDTTSWDRAQALTRAQTGLGYSSNLAQQLPIELGGALLLGPASGMALRAGYAFSAQTAAGLEAGLQGPSQFVGLGIRTSLLQEKEVASAQPEMAGLAHWQYQYWRQEGKPPATQFQGQEFALGMGLSKNLGRLARAWNFSSSMVGAMQAVEIQAQILLGLAYGEVGEENQTLWAAFQGRLGAAVSWDPQRWVAFTEVMLLPGLGMDADWRLGARYFAMESLALDAGLQFGAPAAFTLGLAWFLPVE
jgi:hypothetical protein